MKSLKYISLLVLSIIAFSCKKSNDIPENNDSLKGLKLVQTYQNAQHSIGLYTASGQLSTGYNKVYLQFKNLDGTLLSPDEVSWAPLMHMHSMSHACPSSIPQASTERKGLYEGMFIFQMASNESEYWELKLNYKVKSQDFSAEDRIVVSASTFRNANTFKGVDGQKYILALVSPQKPKVGLNTIEALLYKMDSMTSFSPVMNYSIKIDPRMPGMGNHGSPNNVNLSQKDGAQLYTGVLSYTMTGYWKVNLQVFDAAGTLQKGEALNTSVESSSIFFEQEF